MKTIRDFIISALAGFVVGTGVNVATDSVLLGAACGVAVFLIFNAAFWQAEVRQCRRTMEQREPPETQPMRDRLVEEVERERVMRRTGQR